MFVSKIGIEENAWLFGPWNSRSPIEIGFFRMPKKEVHSHEEVFEYYLVVKGWVKFKVDGKEYSLKQGEICMIEPGEIQTFTEMEKSDDLMCFVVKYPHIPNDKVLL